MEEFERTFLVNNLPEELAKCDFKEIVDIYIPKDREHPTIRIRKNGKKYEMTKKQPIKGRDSSHQLEQTIKLDPAEFQYLSKLDGKKLHKIRYYYPHKNITAEVDVFQDDLVGLVLVDFEFNNHQEKDSFVMPDFCLAEVTQDKFTAGGMLCGKSYKDIEQELKKYNYKRLFFHS